MGVGEGLTVLGICGTLIAAILRLPSPARKNDLMVEDVREKLNQAVTRELCSEKHQNMDRRFDALTAEVRTLRSEIRSDLALLFQRLDQIREKESDG